MGTFIYTTALIILKTFWQGCHSLQYQNNLETGGIHMMDELIREFGKKKLDVLNYLFAKNSEMPVKETAKTGQPSKSPNGEESSPAVPEPIFTNLARKRDTVISALRSSYKTSIYSLNIEQFTMVLFQNRFAPISPFFLAYKYCHAFVMFGALGYSISQIDNHKDNFIAWHLFLDHWMSVVGTAEALCGVFTVTYFYHHCHTKAMRDAYPLTEGLHIRLAVYAFINSTTITFVCASSVIFWFFIYGKSPTTSISIEHIVLPALLLVKMNIERIPFTVDRFMYPVVLLLIYFINVIIHYYVDYRSLFYAGEPKTYVFIYFNEKSLLHFLWFVLESLLITVAVHVVLTLMWHSRWLFTHLCCPKRSRPSRQTPERSSPDDSRVGYPVREDFVEAVPDPTTTPCKRCLERIADLERYYRHDFIQPEWKTKLHNYPSFMYVVYRTGHMTLHFCMVFISLFEPEKPLRLRTVKHFILWLFYFGNFFLCVSLVQALIGFTVIIKAYSRKTSLKYYEQSELYVTGLQKGYATVNGSAVALAVFIFASSWVLVDDTSPKGFPAHDYTYDVPHVVNPLSMCLDFIVVGHPYKFANFLLSFGILGLNIVFNYWLYSSKITGRTGAKFIYQYLKWDEPLTVAPHIAVLYAILIAIHLMLWLMFLGKRSINVVFRRRHLYRPREPKFRTDSGIAIDTEPQQGMPPLAYNLSTRTKTSTDFEIGKNKSAELERSHSRVGQGGSTSEAVPSSRSLQSAKSK